MRPTFVLLIVLVAVAACRRAVEEFPVIAGVTRIELQHQIPGQATPTKSIVHPDSISAIAAFVNARRDGWKPIDESWRPTTVARFFRDNKFLAEVGVGVLGLRRRSQDHVSDREAAAPELLEFVRLIGTPQVLIMGTIKDP